MRACVVGATAASGALDALGAALGGRRATVGAALARRRDGLASRAAPAPTPTDRGRGDRRRPLLDEPRKDEEPGAGDGQHGRRRRGKRSGPSRSSAAAARRLCHALPLPVVCWKLRRGDIAPSGTVPGITSGFGGPPTDGDERAIAPAHRAHRRLGCEPYGPVTAPDGPVTIPPPVIPAAEFGPVVRCKMSGLGERAERERRSCGRRRHRGERREVALELGSRLVAVLRASLQTASDDRVETLRHGGDPRAEPRRFGLEDRGEELAERLAVEGTLAADELEEDDADRPDVGARVDLLRAAQLLGRHVERRAEHRGRRRQLAGRHVERRAARRLRDAEVEHLDDGAPVRTRARKRFAGFRSRWTMPCACAWPTPRSACIT